MLENKNPFERPIDWNDFILPILHTGLKYFAKKNYYLS
jgi:hypothetical protein